MTNEQIRNLLADVALKKVGKTRQELNYKCEETCAEGATDVLNNVARTYSIDGLNVGSVSCNTMYANMSQSPYWYEPNDWMVRGDYIFFDWNLIDEDKPLEHVGICIGVEGDVMQYVNINGSDHNAWTVQSINKYSPNIAYWLRYLNQDQQSEVTTHDDTADIYEKIRELQQQRDNIERQINELILSLCK